MENKNINTERLEKNICDTIKEWQLKIGYQKESMQLYYPMESLLDLLDISDCDRIGLLKILQEFSESTTERLGGIDVSWENGRFCLRIPEKGSTYVHEQVKDSLFLQKFLGEITRKGSTLADVEEVFKEFSGDVVKKEMEDEEIVLYFADPTVDEYVYCISRDEFGMEYHRFTRQDYKKLFQEE